MNPVTGVRSTASQRRAILLVLTLFVFACAWTYAGGGDDGGGDDLSASYVGAKLLATGHGGSLYRHDSADFSVVHDTDWDEMAKEGGFDGFLHPYVQTPAWAYLLQPLAMHTSFRTFNGVFSVLSSVCFAALIWVVAREWCPLLFQPTALALVAGCLFLSIPFRYAMFLTQTHVIFVLLVVVALVLADRSPIAAGALLSLAAAVKITPGLLVVYWLVTRRWKAAASFGVASGAILIGTVAATGPGLFVEYLKALERISGLLLVSYNNQSFAAFVMAHWYPPTEYVALHIFALPRAMRWGSTALLLGSLLLGGWWDRGRKTGAPLGAIFALVGATIFTPLAWTHYFILLLIPVMVLIETNLALRSRSLTVSLVAIVAMNFQPLAMDARDISMDDLSLMRAHFFAGVLSLGALALAHALETRQTDKSLQNN